MIASTIPKQRTVDHMVMMCHGKAPGPRQPLPTQSRGPQTFGHGAARISESNKNKWVRQEMTIRPRPPFPAHSSGPQTIGPGAVRFSESNQVQASEIGNDCKATSAVSRAQPRAADYRARRGQNPGSVQSESDNQDLNP